jgi:hypothetical protein
MQPTRTILIYGKTKVGKTLDAAYTFGKNGYFLLSEPDGLASVEACLGFMPEHYELTNLANPYAEVTQHLQKVLLPLIKKGQVKCVIFDTGSEFADRLLSVELDNVGADARRAYPQVYRKFTSVIRTILLSGAWVVMLCHQKIADPDNDRMGGPLLPGRLVESIPSQFSLILRASVKNTPAGRQRVYYCDPLDPEFLMGDRYGVAFEEQPMELRAIMWRIAHPGEDTPAVELAGKPIRLGGKVYAPGKLPKKFVDPLEGLVDLPGGATSAKGEAVSEEPVVAQPVDDLMTPSEAKAVETPEASEKLVDAQPVDDLMTPPEANSSSGLV